MVQMFFNNNDKLLQLISKIYFFNQIAREIDHSYCQIHFFNETKEATNNFFLQTNELETCEIAIDFLFIFQSRFSFLSSVHVIIVVIVVIIIIVIVVIIIVIVDRHTASVCQTKKCQKDCYKIKKMVIQFYSYLVFNL